MVKYLHEHNVITRINLNIIIIRYINSLIILVKTYIKKKAKQNNSVVDANKLKKPI